MIKIARLTIAYAKHTDHDHGMEEVLEAAPEMLEALESMVGRFGAATSNILDNVALKDARALLAKIKEG